MSKKTIKKLTHEEILKTKPSVDDVLQKKRTPVYIILDNIRSLYNVGAIFRTSDAVLIEKIFLCGITGEPPRKEISKTALGAEELVPYEHRDDAVEVVKELKNAGVHILAVELADEAVDYSKMKYDFPVALVFGHEVEGVSDEVMEEVDGAISLPMLGRANSLNVATCYGIVVYEILKQLK